MLTGYLSFYQELLGFTPYDYQVEVANKLLQGKNVILSVSTGAGKTWASVMPFLYAKEYALAGFPQKMIFSTPLRTLTNSINIDLKEVLSSDRVKKNYPDLADWMAVQTGECCDDPYFEKTMVFSTIDQTLSNYLCFPLPLSHRQANINAGSIIGSYLVFDEFHLLDPQLSMATTLGMLRMLGGLCRVCIMTATLTDDYIRFLQRELENYEVISLKDFPNDVTKIKSLLPAPGKKTKKAITIEQKCINADAVLTKHKNKTIVICNRVETAQRIFEEIRQKESDDIKLLCIHSRFFDSDRKRIEREIKTYFGKNSKEQNVILVATQVIEAGMDISCDVMHTEISPINSFLQRIGRCARFEYEFGHVYVYDVLSLEEKEKISIDTEKDDDIIEIRKLNNKYLPYSKELCERSWDALNECSFVDEQVATQLVNDVLKEDERLKAEKITERSFNYREIEDSWQSCDKKYYRKTIRDIQSVELILFDVENNHAKQVIPWKYESLGVYRWSFINWVKRLMQDKIEDGDWIVGKAESGEDSVIDLDWGGGETYYLRKLDYNDLKNHYNVIFVDYRYFDYGDAGLLVSNNDHEVVSPLKFREQREKQQRVLKKDSFYEHNMAILNCYETEVKSNLKFAYDKLDGFWGRKLDWDRLIKLMICMHDYGKLNVDWQKPVLEFQRRKSGIPDLLEVLAHTDYVEGVDKELAGVCGVNKKPPHAGIGASQLYDMLEEEWGEDIARSASCAVLRHHSTETDSYKTFSISDYCMHEMQRLMRDNQLNGVPAARGRGENLSYVIPATSKEWILYLFLVRILRMCDQKATESMEKYRNTI